MVSADSWFIRARLRTRHLLLLTAIGEEGNIHKAAELLNMSQPAASRLLSDLEEIIGSPLFDRLPRGVRANWYGETMIRHARIVLDRLNEASHEIALLKAGLTGHVNVGAICGPAISFVPRAIAAVVGEFPLIRIQLLVDSSNELLELLKDGKIEVMVGRLLERHDTSNFEYKPLADEPVCAAVRNGHPLLERGEIQIGELANQAWIVPPVGSILRHRFDLMFREAGHHSPKQIIEATSPMIMTRLLEETNHVAVIARDVVEYYVACGLIAKLPVSLSCNMDSFGIITRKDWALSAAACEVCEALEAEVTGSTRARRRVAKAVAC
jgi:DNA-binding transcriptional LysR family regulator